MKIRPRILNNLIGSWQDWSHRIRDFQTHRNDRTIKMHVLFLSNHDLFRGPMARAMTQNFAKEFNVFDTSFDSAGIDVQVPTPPEREFAKFLYEHRVSLKGHRSKPLLAPQIRWANLILCMTHEIADSAKKMVGPPHKGKVVVFNDAVGFGRKKSDMDIPPIQAGSLHSYQAIYSQMRATAGRFARMLGDGDTEPADYGAVDANTKPDQYLDDPHLRNFLGRYILEFIERAFEPPTTRHICEALEGMGRPLSVIDVEEMLRNDLAPKIQAHPMGGWETRPKAPPKADEPEEEEPREDNGASEEKLRVEDKISFEEALELFALTENTTLEYAQKIFRKMQMRYHPDKFHDDEDFRKMAEAKAKRLNLAWKVLRDKLPNE